MTKALLCGILLTSLMANPGTPTSQPGSASTAPKPTQTPEKLAALKIRTELFSLVRANPTGQPSWADIDAKIAKYQTDFGVTPETTNNLFQLRKYQISVGRRLGDKIPFATFLQTLSTDSNPEIAALAKKQMEVQGRLTELDSKPLELKVTGVDGKEIDVSKLRGKVVLMDFWATWCGPCVKEVPQVVETYKKFHDKGFEIVGISLDSDKDKLLAFTKDKGMDWPQYYDGKVWSNVIAKDFGISSIPAMWLLDKKGMVVTREARKDLAGQVEKLLQAP